MGAHVSIIVIVNSVIAMPQDEKKDTQNQAKGLLSRQRPRLDAPQTMQAIAFAAPISPRGSAQSNSSPGGRATVGTFAWSSPTSQSPRPGISRNSSILDQDLDLSDRTSPLFPTSRTKSSRPESPCFPQVKSPLPPGAIRSRSVSGSGSETLRLQPSNPGTLTALFQRLSMPKQGKRAGAKEPMSPFLQSSTPIRIQSSISRASSQAALLPTPPSTAKAGSISHSNRVSVTSGRGSASLTAVPPPMVASKQPDLPPLSRPTSDEAAAVQNVELAAEPSMSHLSPAMSTSLDQYDLYDPDGPDEVHHEAIHRT